MEYSDLIYLCALSRIFTYDCKLALKLMEVFPAPESLFVMEKGALTEIFGSGSPYIEHLLDRKILEDAFKEVEWAGSKGVRILGYRDAGYPGRLKECPDAPLILFMKGTANLNAERILSIVGTRKATSYGLEMCRQIVRSVADLEMKPLIVSGLAYGIDICAHREALDSGLDTLGIMATGIDEIYPILHRNDAVKMCSQGGVVSEYWRGSPPNRYNFVRRNRIIAGMCDAVVLVESDRSGGGVVTSKMAFSYGREVLAVPGRLSDRWSSGCNCLISSGAAYSISSPDDVAKQMGWKKTDVRVSDWNSKIFPSDDALTRNILVTLSNHPEMDMDMICSCVSAECSDIISALTMLEMEERIISDDRGLFRIKG